MSCLDPREIYSNPTLCRTQFRRVLVSLRNAEKVNSDSCDTILDQFNEFIDTTSPEIFKQYSLQNDRLDTFFHEHVSPQKYDQLFSVIKMLLVMSHGQAVVERGFSINKEVETVNLSEKNLVAQRVICDYVSYFGGVINVPLTKELIASVASARSRYELYLDAERKKKLSEEQSRKRKSVLEDTEDLKTKKKRLKSDIDNLIVKADKLAEDAEKKGQITLVTQSNCLRKRSKEKEEELKKVEEDITKLVDSLKQ